ncbi:MAG: bifunctional helix-turn-helix domain-containing protein/methylated-DNA--[protein]-cysteine S-methyltransferase, partial [Chitinophagaceae bacterium]
MSEGEQQINYCRIAEAIDYIKINFKEQPNLDDVAKKVHLSPYHFQKLFTDWAGVSPKKFLQYISLMHARKMLTVNQLTLTDAALESGLSGTGRLHDLFIQIEGMTPGEFKSGGQNLSINYNHAESPFGNILVASTSKGICYMAFEDNDQDSFQVLLESFPQAKFLQSSDQFQENALKIFKKDWNKLDLIKLHLKGTAFKLKVWEALLKIPFGQLSTYGSIAAEINQSNASRAVGSAIANNPVAFLIPCHRVIQASGIFGGYRWGNTRKSAIIGWEAAKTCLDN